jgi:hypothetical protein
VYVGDSGEMATIARTLGVAQPTGFPLYCLLGRLAALVPLGGIAARVNLVSAVATAAAAFAVYWIAARRARPSLALAASLTYALGATAWSQATVARTYPVAQAFLAWELALALWLWDRPGHRRFMGFSLLVGISLSTHLLALQALPLLLALAVRESWPRRAAATGLFALGLTLYAYVPLRAPVTPYNVYGALSSAAELLSYLRQERYARKQFSRSPANLRAAASTLGNALLAEHPWAPLLLLVSMAGLRRAGRPLVDFLAIVALANLGIMLAYGDDQDIPFLPRYFLAVAMALAILGALGAEELVARTTRPAGAGRVAVAAGALLVGWSFAANLATCDRSRTLFPEEYARRLLRFLPGDSILFLQGDAPTLMCDYLQHCEAVRTDVPRGGPEDWARFASGLAAPFRVIPRRTFANFLPSQLPYGYRAVHRGLLWELTWREPTLDAEAVWAGWEPAAVLTDPCLSDYEGAALAGEILFHRGLDRLEQGRAAEARAEFERARRVSARNRLLFYSLARVYAKAGWLDEARELVEQGLARDVTAGAAGEEYRAERYRAAGLAPFSVPPRSPPGPGPTVPAP